MLMEWLVLSMQVIAILLLIVGVLPYSLPSKPPTLVEQYKSTQLIEFSGTNFSVLRTSSIDKELIAQKGYKILKFDNKGIYRISRYIFLNFKIHGIIITNNNISRISSYTFVDLYNIIEINLDNNNIEYIEQYAFVHLPQLATVSLCHNKIRQFDGNKIIATEMNKLYLTNNSLTNFSVIFKEMAWLSHLYLEYNSINDINIKTNSEDPLRIFVINASYNNLSRINDAFFKQVYVTTFNVAYNNLRKVPLTFFESGTKVVLILSGNPIKKIDLLRYTQMCIDSDIEKEIKFDGDLNGSVKYIPYLIYLMALNVIYVLYC